MKVKHVTVLLLILGALLASLPTASAQSGSCNQGITVFGSRIHCETDNCEVESPFLSDGLVCYGPMWCDPYMCATPVCLTDSSNICVLEDPSQPPSDCIVELDRLGLLCEGDMWCDFNTGICAYPLCLSRTGSICLFENPDNYMNRCSVPVYLVGGFWCIHPTQPGWRCVTHHGIVCIPPILILPDAM